MFTIMFEMCFIVLCNVFLIHHNMLSATCKGLLIPSWMGMFHAAFTILTSSIPRKYDFTTLHYTTFHTQTHKITQFYANWVLERTSFTNNTIFFQFECIGLWQLSTHRYTYAPQNRGRYPYTYKNSW